MGYYASGQLWKFGTPSSLLSFKPLNWVQKCQFVVSTLALKWISSQKYTEKYSAKEWFKTIGCSAVWDIIWKPLFSLKFDKDADTISLTWLWDKIRIRGSSRSPSGTKEQLAYMSGSFGVISNALQTQILNLGGDIKLNCRIHNITQTAEGFQLATTDGSLHFDQLICTVSSEVLGKLFSFGPSFKNYLSSLTYTSAICVLIELDRPYSPYYWTNVGDSSFPFGGIVEHTNFMDSSLYGDRHLMYISRYISSSDPMFKSFTDSEIQASFVSGLRQINPQFNPDSIQSVKVFRQPNAQPIVPKGYRPPKMDTEIPGLYWISTHHTYPHDRGINYAISLAFELVGTA